MDIYSREERRVKRLGMRSISLTKVPDPIGAGAHCISSCTSLQRIYFGRVKLCAFYQHDNQISSVHGLDKGFSWALTQGRGSQVAPKLAMKRKSPVAAPLAAAVVPGIKHAKTTTILRHCPTVPQRKSFLRPTLSMINQLTVAKIAYTIMFTPPNKRLILCVWWILCSNRMGK